MKNKFSILLILVLSITGCETYVDVDIPQQESKLVVVCFISPQEPITKISVSASSPLFKETSVNIYDQITDAEVEISDGQITYTVPYDEIQGYHFDNTSFPINAGVSYTLTVSAPGFKPVRATTKVPSATAFLENAEVSFVYVAGTNSDANQNLNFNLSWLDQEIEDNYYGLEFYFYGLDYESHYFSSLATDKDKNLQQINKSFSGPSTFGGVTETPSFRVYLLNASESYYLFKNSLMNQNNGDPFSEPTLIYTNIENGFGCFGAYNGSSRIID
jgi:hypothetical protein